MLTPVQARATQFTPGVKASTFAKSHRAELSPELKSDAVTPSNPATKSEFGLITGTILAFIMTPLRLAFEHFVVGSTAKHSENAPILKRFEAMA